MTVRAIREWPVPSAYSDWSIPDFDESILPSPVQRSGHGILIAGPVGTGKSSLAGALARDAIENAAMSASSVVWHRTRSLLGSLLSASLEAKGDLLQSLHRCGLLVLDDFGAAKESDWSMSELFNAIGERCDRDLPTIVTTNLSYEQLVELDERAADRLRVFERVVMDGASRRGNGGEPSRPLVLAEIEREQDHWAAARDERRRESGWGASPRAFLPAQERRKFDAYMAEIRPAIAAEQARLGLRLTGEEMRKLRDRFKAKHWGKTAGGAL